jgi:nucleotide-binding universal stress UspA family protein
MLPLRKIFHPTDFSVNDRTTLAHALKLACLFKAEFTMMHVDPTVGRNDFEDFPRIRPLLAAWGLLPEGSAKEEVSRLGIEIKKIRAVADNTSAAILHYLATDPTDLLVLSTHQREGLSRLTHETIAEPVARGSRAKTLFIPAGVEGFVSLETGALNLRRILIPVSREPNPQPAIDAAAELARLGGSEQVLFELLFLGSDEEFPRLTKPEQTGWTWESLIAKGSSTDWILAAGKDFDVDLIVMVTEGHNSIIDVLMGSTTERVLRGARSPLLTIPS